MGKRKFTDKDYQEWKRLYVIEMWSTCRIAEKYGCDPTLIRHHLKRLGVKTRTWKEALNLPYPKKKLMEVNKGKVGPMSGKRHTEEAKQKMSKSQKGKKHTEKAKQKMRKAALGRKMFDEAKQKISKANKGKHLGAENPMFGKHHSEDIKEKISKARKGKYKGLENPFYGKHHTEVSKDKQRKAMKGKPGLKGSKNPNWQGGIGKLPYAFDFTKKKKQLIKERDEFRCQFPKCSIRKRSRTLVVHHIDYDKQNSKNSNLITLCGGHNIEVNSDRGYWTKYFQKLVKEEDK